MARTPTNDNAAYRVVDTRTGEDVTATQTNADRKMWAYADAAAFRSVLA